MVKNGCHVQTRKVQRRVQALGRWSDPTPGVQLSQVARDIGMACRRSGLLPARVELLPDYLENPHGILILGYTPRRVGRSRRHRHDLGPRLERGPRGCRTGCAVGASSIRNFASCRRGTTGRNPRCRTRARDRGLHHRPPRRSRAPLCLDRSEGCRHRQQASGQGGGIDCDVQQQRMAGSRRRQCSSASLL